MTVQCCACNRFRADNRWVDKVLDHKGLRISYTYCPHCLAKVMATLHRDHAEQRLTLKHAAP